MAGIFDGLEKFGLSDFMEIDLFQTDAKAVVKKMEKVAKPFDIKDYVYSKEFDCPVCGKTFGSNIIRTGKVRLISIDYDLRPIFEPIEPLFYDVVICTKCGYGAVKQQFLNIREQQIDLISQQLSPKYIPVTYPDELDIDMAIERYKLVLLNAYIKKARDGEKAYICMKLCWLYRIKKDRENELLFAEHTYTGFAKAFIEEHPPIMGLEESTIIYILGSFSKTLALYEDSLRHLSKIIVSKTASESLKERSRELKNAIMAEKKA